MNHNSVASAGHQWGCHSCILINVDCLCTSSTSFSVKVLHPGLDSIPRARHCMNSLREQLSLNTRTDTFCWESCHVDFWTVLAGASCAAAVSLPQFCRPVRALFGYLCCRPSHPQRCQPWFTLVVSSFFCSSCSVRFLRILRPNIILEFLISQRSLQDFSKHPNKSVTSLFVPTPSFAHSC